MNSHELLTKEKTRKDRGKKAVSLAMQSRWEDAASLNRSIIEDFPDDLEAFNRLGKALSELGRNGEAMEAFQKALAISPHNSIARKNLDRLSRLGDEAPQRSQTTNTTTQVFIEESGKAGVTSLLSLPNSKVLLKLSPGHAVLLNLDGAKLTVTDSAGEYLGKVEPRLASRLARLIGGGNRYDATVTSVAQRELSIIIRESYKHPSQAGIVSFPSRGGADYRVYLPSAVIGYEGGDEDSGEANAPVIKDWSDDDTEPGDDDAFTPVFHRIINAGDEESGEDGDF